MKKAISVLLAAVLMTLTFIPGLSAFGAELKTPTFSKESGAYSGSVNVSISSSNLLTDIYYEIYDYGKSNFKGALKQTATKYTSPLTITESCYISAWVERSGDTSQKETQRYYIKYTSDEGRFEVNENGTLTAYTGNTANLVIPDEVNGIPVTAIGEYCFAQYDNDHREMTWYNLDDYSNYLKTVTLPDTVTIIGRDAFAACINLTDVYGGSIRHVDTNGFIKCERLKNINLSHTADIGSSAFQETALEQIDNDSITSIGASAFAETTVRSVSMSNLNDCDRYVFRDCKSLLYVDLPKMAEFPRCMFQGTYPFMINAPSLKDVDKNAFWHNDYAPADNYAPIGIHAAKLAGALGGSIRLSDSGLRFGFNWDNSTDLEAAFGDEIEYGFIYAYEETDDLMFNQMKTVENGYSKVATKHTEKNGKTSFNLVFTDIPKANYDTKISARAYIRIYNWYFYSDILTRSFEDVANAVLADNTIDEATKDQVRSILEA